MKKFLFHLLWLSFLIFSLAACGGGGDTAAGAAAPAAATTSSISGVVADGYVSGATVKVYSDVDMTAEIGSGTTDASGNFSITISANPVPAILYIKTTGGLDIDTNMPAPTMMFAGAYVDGSLNVTPLTDRVVKEFISAGGTLEGAYTTISGKLGISDANLKGNPVTNPATESGMYDILSSGTQGNTLPDGNYQIKLLYFLGDEMRDGLYITGITSGAKPIEGRVKTISIEITGGNITGTFNIDDVAGDETIEGRVQGTALYMNFYNATTNTVFRFAGELALSSASGNVLKVVGTAVTSGLFLATFTKDAPQTDDQKGHLFAAIAHVMEGWNYAAARDVFFYGKPRIAWGSGKIATFHPGDFTHFDYTELNISVFTDFDTELPIVEEKAGIATFIGDSRIWVSRETFLWATTVPIWNAGSSTWEETPVGNLTLDLYHIGVAGNPKGMALSVTPVIGNPFAAFSNRVAAITERVGMRNSTAAIFLQPSATYNVQAAVVDVQMLAKTRTSLLDTVNNPSAANFEMAFSGGSFTAPALNSDGLLIGWEASAHGTSPYVTKIVSGNTFITRSDNTEDWAAFNGAVSGADYLMSVEMYEGGAMSGTRLQGGTFLTYNLAYLPMSMVMFAQKVGTTPPNVIGTRNFLARSLYSTLGGGTASGNYTYHKNAWSYGSLTINTVTGIGSLTITSSGVTVTVPMTVVKETGMVHIYGALGEGYLDLYWPVGGKKATYVRSANTAGTGLVTDVGEAYVTE